MILKIETPKDSQLAIDDLDVVEVLGFDCITSVDLSYLDMDPKGIIGLERMFIRLNPNHLFDTINDAYEFLDIYNKLLSEGVNLEYGDNLVPALLSVVRIKGRQGKHRRQGGT